jgi:4-carboxymuconolactone decarboxylase
MSDFGTFGRYAELPLEQMDGDQRQAYDDLVRLRGEVPGPYKIILQNARLLRAIAPLGAYFQTESTLTKAEIEIVTNLTNGRWLAAYSNYEHERIGQEAGHLPAEKVEALIAGLPTSFDDARQQIVYEVAFALLQLRVLPVGLYRRAVSLLGDEGLTDLTVLIGYFTSVSMTLMAYDVPSSAVGIER